MYFRVRRLLLSTLLTLALTVSGIDWPMYNCMVSNCCEDRNQFLEWKDVLCAMSRYGFIPPTCWP
jgi:hypothetical protein